MLSLFQSAGPLLRHKQLGIMSFDLTLMTDSASVPAGREQASKGGQANKRAQREREKKEKKNKKNKLALICPTIKGEQFQFLFVSSKNFHEDVFCCHARVERNEAELRE